MASSNRHWPSMFKSKPCNNQWQHHDIVSSSCHKTPFNNNQVTGPCEERTPEPKPRWNPRPEQIRILESIFNSGMVNPPRDEIRKIRVQLQEYGQVGDANVFYWFQNRKSRSKHKQRQLQTSKSASTHATPPTSLPAPVVTLASTSSSTSSNKSSSSPNSAKKSLSVGSTANVMDLLNSPTCSVNQPFFTTTGPNEFLTEPFFFPVQKNVGSDVLGQGFCFPNDQSVENCSPSFLLSELMLMSQSSGEKKDDDDDGKMKLQQTHHVSYGGTSNAVDCNVGHSTIVPQSTSLPFPNPTSYILQGVADIGPTNKSTVFINDVCFEVGLGPFNVREAFGDDAVLFHSSGQPVLTNEWGLTLQPLQHGAFYYLVRASPDLRTIDLI